MGELGDRKYKNQIKKQFDHRDLATLVAASNAQ